jgi:hypothetical protein
VSIKQKAPTKAYGSQLLQARVIILVAIINIIILVILVTMTAILKAILIVIMDIHEPQPVTSPPQ